MMRIGLKFPEYVEKLESLWAGKNLDAIVTHCKQVESFFGGAVDGNVDGRIEAGMAICMYLREAQYNWDNSSELEFEE